MRTIKFKAKTLKTGEWAVGDLVCSNGKFFIKHEDEPDKVFPLCTKVDPDTVCEFTGFLDKNGNEIYDGDVLRSDKHPFSCLEDNDIDNYYGIIGWSEEAASFCMVSAQNPKSYILGMSDGISDSISQNKMQDFEVIGNVHDEEWKQYRAYIQDEDEGQHQ